MFASCSARYHRALRAALLLLPSIMLVAGSPAPVAAQAVYELTGTVTAQATNAPVPRTRIVIFEASDGTPLDTLFTDAGGSYAGSLPGTVSAEEPERVPDAYAVSPIHPSPLTARAAASLTLHYTVPQNRREAAVLEVYDVLGRRVTHSAVLPAGVYFYALQFESGARSETRRIVLVEPCAPRFTLVQASEIGRAARTSVPLAHARAAVEVTLRFEKRGLVTQEITTTLTAEDNVIDVALAAAPLPTARFVAPESPQAGQPVVFDASASTGAGEGPVLSYGWDFGDGRLGGDVRLAHVFSEPGEYEVTLTVAGLYGAVDTARQVIVVQPAPPPVSMDGVVTGRVTDPAGRPMPDVVVRLLGGGAVDTTGFPGEVRLTGVPVGTPVTLQLTRSGYAAQRVPLLIPAATTEAAFGAVLLPRAEPVRLENVELGGVALGSDGVRVELPVEALVRADGSVVEGAVDVFLTPVNVQTVHGFNAFPGEFAGVTPDGPADLILSLGVAEYVFEQDGEELQLAPGVAALIEMPIYATADEEGNPVTAGDTFPLWSLDETTGIWVQEGVGVAAPSEASPTGFAFRGMVSHMSWWNCDIAPRPFTPGVRPFKPDCEKQAQEVCQGLPDEESCIAVMTAVCADPDGDEEPGPDREDGDPTDDEEYEEQLYSDCDANPLFCEDICQVLPGFCDPTFLRGEPENPFGNPLGAPRNRNMPPGGEDGIPLPPDQDIRLTATGDNGLVRGQVTVRGGAGDSPVILIPMFPLPEPGEASLACNTPAAGAIDPEGEVDTWTFSGTAGDFVLLDGRQGEGSSLVADLTVRTPSGADLVTGWRLSQDHQVRRLPETGLYTFIVDGTDNEPGAYQVEVVCAVPFAPDQNVAASIAPRQRLLYSFDLAQDAVVATGIQRGEDLRGSIVTEIWGETAESNASNGVYALAAGSYAVAAYGGGADHTGSFTMGLPLLEEPATVTPPALGALSMEGELTVVGDRQYYRFTSPGGEYRSFGLRHPDGSEIRAELRIHEPSTTPYYRRSGTADAATGRTVRADFTAPALLEEAGEYLLEVRPVLNTDFPLGPYTLTAVAPKEVASLALDAEDTGTLDGYEMVRYTFEAPTGSLVATGFLPEAFTGTAESRVFDPDGQVLATADAGDGAYRGSPVLVVEKPGLYSVIVSHRTDAAAGSGAYRVGLARIEEPEPLAVSAAGATVAEGELTVLGDRHFYSFTGTAGEFRAVGLESPAGSALNATLHLDPPRDAPFYQRQCCLAASTTAGRRVDFNEPDALSQSGEYILEVTPVASMASPKGRYSVTVLAPREVIPAELDTEYTGTLDGYEMVRYTIDEPVGTHVGTAVIEEGFTGDLEFRVFAPDGSRLWFSGTGAGAATDAPIFTVEQEGLYTVFVSYHYPNTALAGSGGYRVGIARIEEPEVLTLEEALTVREDTLSILGDHTFYSFQGTAGDVRSITLSHPGGTVSTAFLIVRRPEAGEVFYDRNSLTTLIFSTNSDRRSVNYTPTLPTTGEYVIEIEGRGNTYPERTGPHVLTVEKR